MRALCWLYRAPLVVLPRRLENVERRAKQALFEQGAHAPRGKIPARSPAAGRRLVCYAAIVVVLFAQCASALAAPLSFYIKPGDEGAQLLKLFTSSKHQVVCEFKFATRQAMPMADARQNDDGADAIVPQGDNVFARLSGVCIRRTIDYWKYEVCFEGQIKQSHGDATKILGRYAGVEASHQLYDEGTPCESKAERGGRKARVEFVCDKQLRIRSVDEHGACSYLVVVGTPVVCGRLEFATAPPEEFDAAGGVVESSRELWGMELVELANGHVQCDVRVRVSDTRGGERSAAVEFARFSVDVYADTTSEVSLALDLHVCRAPERVRLSLADREYALITEANRILVKSADSFLGRLEYVLVQVAASASVAAVVS